MKHIKSFNEAITISNDYNPLFNIIEDYMVELSDDGFKIHISNGEHIKTVGHTSYSNGKRVVTHGIGISLFKLKANCLEEYKDNYNAIENILKTIVKRLGKNWKYELEALNQTSPYFLSHAFLWDESKIITESIQQYRSISSQIMTDNIYNIIQDNLIELSDNGYEINIVTTMKQTCHGAKYIGIGVMITKDEIVDDYHRINTIMNNTLRRLGKNWKVQFDIVGSSISEKKYKAFFYDSSQPISESIYTTKDDTNPLLDTIEDYLVELSDDDYRIEISNRIFKKREGVRLTISKKIMDYDKVDKDIKHLTKRLGKNWVLNFRIIGNVYHAFLYDSSQPISESIYKTKDDTNKLFDNILLESSSSDLIEKIDRIQYLEYISNVITFDDDDVKKIQKMFPKFSVELHSFFIHGHVVKGLIFKLVLKYTSGPEVFRVFKLPDEYFISNPSDTSSRRLYFKIDDYEGLEDFCQKILAGYYI